MTYPGSLHANTLPARPCPNRSLGGPMRGPLELERRLLLELERRLLLELERRLDLKPEYDILFSCVFL